MYDRLLAGGFEFPPHRNRERARIESQELMGLLRRAQVFDIQNVAEYYYSYLGEDDIRTWRITDFPNAAPPFEACFMEFRVPRHPAFVRASGGDPAYAVGVLSKAIVRSDPNFPELRGEDRVAKELRDNARWLVTNALFLEWRKWQKPEAFLTYAFAVKNNGELFIEHEGRWAAGLLYEDYLDYYPDRQSEIDKEETSKLFFLSTPYFFPTLLALSFLHCKGVTVEQNPPVPRLSRTFQKRHGNSLVSFHTLHIEPMKKIIETQGQVKNLGLKRALHIVRGHFADYTESGLFGRHHGLYWFPQHMRGVSEEGLSLKDYHFRPVKQDDSSSALK
ncbi:hypothetical protein HYU96_00200 [Candidatus Daviesbacteria bacterium]|nr:hypothetical protein [Candidatus Daviesbacteria bacterium]